jgi:hypothetical protein
VLCKYNGMSFLVGCKMYKKVAKILQLLRLMPWKEFGRFLDRQMSRLHPMPYYHQSSSISFMYVSLSVKKVSNNGKILSLTVWWRGLQPESRRAPLVNENISLIRFNYPRMTMSVYLALSYSPDR